MHVIDLKLLTIIPPGRKPEEEGVEDNGLEENSGDGQVRASLPVNLLSDGPVAVHPLMVVFCYVTGGC